jgi:predicted nucleotidyltransferase
MRTKPPAVLPIFRSDLQARLLAALLLERTPVTARELLDRLETTSTTLHRELGRLEQAGLIEHELVGRTRRYQPAFDSPLYEPLLQLMQRTLGVEPMLSHRLLEIPGVEVAAIFGSWAAGDATVDSDIDLLVVGDVDREELLFVVQSVEYETAREIDVTAYRREELDRRLAEGSGFLRTILNGPLTLLVGEIG